MKIDHGHFFQQTQENSINTDQSQSIQTPDSQNNPVDSLDVHDGSDVFLGADDVFLLQSAEGDALKQSAEDFRSGNVTTSDSADGFQLQDAMKPRSHSLGADLPQQFTDYISSLQKAVNAALDGDAAAFEKVEAAFGFLPEKQNSFEVLLSNGSTEISASQPEAGKASDQPFDIGIDPGDRLPDRDWVHDDEPDVPHDPESSDDGGVDHTPEGTQDADHDPVFVAEGEHDPEPADAGSHDAGTQPTDEGSHDAGTQPDAGTEGSGSSFTLSGNDEDDDLEDLEIQRYIDPDSIGSDVAVLNERFVLYGGGITDGVRPDTDTSAPEMSPEQLPGFGVIDTTPEVDDYSAAVGTIRTFGPGGDTVNPDMQNEPPTGPPPATDGDYSHND